MKKVLLGIVYWICQLTWGILMNIIGACATLFCLVFLKGRIHRNGYGFITEVGGNWGGVSLGAFALCGRYTEIYPSFFQEVRRHEFGHSIQNMFLGIFFPFVVAIPSAIRYWLSYFDKLKEDYEAAWFEHTATSWGTKWINWIEEGK